MEIEPNTQIGLTSSPSEVRTVRDNDGTCWFVAADVCRAFGIKHVGAAITRISAGDKTRRWLQTGGGQQLTAVLSKQGVYALAVSSEELSARDFMQRTLSLLSVDALRLVIAGFSTTGSSERAQNDREETQA